jgi:hypothetical protein
MYIIRRIYYGCISLAKLFPQYIWKFVNCFNKFNDDPSYLQRGIARARRNSSSRLMVKYVSYQGDRFIPNRGAMDIDVAHFHLMRESKENANSNLKVVSALKVETL